jgi:tRNA A-37 threonylcarbamoyl transferase component Bud32
MPEIIERLTTALSDRYDIDREIGAGGMATVYLAHDVKHDRKVALKVLLPELAAVIGAERFLQEIKVTANLQHPHILQLYDSGEADTFLFYVMPFVDGETLRDKLDREKQLAIDEAIEITTSIAAALDYAHRQDVVHRDIKPENILLHDGQAMVADFGIALAVSEAGATRLTETGLSIGTPQYMSPEQAMGDRALDARSDVYSLSAMLYEMLTGDPPYTGSTAQAIVAKVITEKPPEVTAVRDTVPPHVAATIHQALAKLPADRFASASAFAESLKQPGMASVQATATSMSPQPQTRSIPTWVLAFVALVFLAVGSGLGWVLRPDATVRVERFRASGAVPHLRGSGTRLWRCHLARRVHGGRVDAGRGRGLSPVPTFPRPTRAPNDPRDRQRPAAHVFARRSRSGVHGSRGAVENLDRRRTAGHGCRYRRFPVFARVGAGRPYLLHFPDVSVDVENSGRRWCRGRNLEGGHRVLQRVHGAPPFATQR